RYPVSSAPPKASQASERSGMSSGRLIPISRRTATGRDARLFKRLQSARSNSLVVLGPSRHRRHLSEKDNPFIGHIELILANPIFYHSDCFHDWRRSGQTGACGELVFDAAEHRANRKGGSGCCGCKSATSTEFASSGCCCDRCHAERVIPERVRRMLERHAKREGNG